MEKLSWLDAAGHHLEAAGSAARIQGVPNSHFRERGNLDDLAISR
jgi:hypothetical protein